MSKSKNSDRKVWWVGKGFGEGLSFLNGKVSKIFPEETFDFSPTTKINILEKVV
jgi:hypothetical protein